MLRVNRDSDRYEGVVTEQSKKKEKTKRCKFCAQPLTHVSFLMALSSFHDPSIAKYCSFRCQAADRWKSGLVASVIIIVVSFLLIGYDFLIGMIITAFGLFAIGTALWGRSTAGQLRDKFAPSDTQSSKKNKISVQWCHE